MYNHSTYDRAVKLIADAMAVSPDRGIIMTQNAQAIFRNMALWPEYWQARSLESQLRLKRSNDSIMKPLPSPSPSTAGNKWQEKDKNQSKLQSKNHCNSEL